MTILITTDDADDTSWAGMTMGQLYVKHHRLRGTDDLKYLGDRRHRCPSTCGLDDMHTGEWGVRRTEQHQCYLRPFHTGDCEFSSECARMHGEGGVQ